MPGDAVTLELSADEALVLLDWLYRRGDGGAPLVTHPSEQTVLWRVEGQLESRLVAPLKRDYQALLAEARERLSGQGEDMDTRQRDSQEDRGERLGTAELASLVVDALLRAKIVSPRDVGPAMRIVGEEIDARKALGDY